MVVWKFATRAATNPTWERRLRHLHPLQVVILLIGAAVSGALPPFAGYIFYYFVCGALSSNVTLVALILWHWAEHYNGGEWSPLPPVLLFVHAVMLMIFSLLVSHRFIWDTLETGCAASFFVICVGALYAMVLYMTCWIANASAATKPPYQMLVRRGYPSLCFLVWIMSWCDPFGGMFYIWYVPCLVLVVLSAGGVYRWYQKYGNHSPTTRLGGAEDEETTNGMSSVIVA